MTAPTVSWQLVWLNAGTQPSFVACVGDIRVIDESGED